MIEALTRASRGSGALRARDTARRPAEAVLRAAAGNYRLHGGGDPDLFKAFAERFLDLVRIGGAVGCVLPRQLLVARGSQPSDASLHALVVQSADVLGTGESGRSRRVSPDADDAARRAQAAAAPEP